MRVLKGTMKLMIQASVMMAVVLFTLPYILSTALGLQTATAAASAILPGRVEVAKVQMGWRQPVLVRGMRVHEDHREGSRVLLEVEAITTAEPLLNIVTGREFHLVVSRPVIDGSIREDNGVARVVDFLQRAHLLKRPSLKAPGEALKWDTTDSDSLAPGGGSMVGPPDMGNFPDCTNEARWSLRQRLTQCSARTTFGVEVHALTGHIFVSEGVIRWPHELSEIVGGDLHLTALMGNHHIEDWGREVREDTDWQEEKGPRQESEGLALKKWNWRGSQPVAVLLEGDNVAGQVKGWVDRRRSQVLLHSPASLVLGYSPSLAQLGLGEVNPLLRQVVELKEGGQVYISFMPDDQVLPSDSLSISVGALHVRLLRTPLLGRVLDLLGANEGQGGEVEAWVTPMILKYDIKRDQMESQRVDMLIGSGRRGLHLCLWGLVDLASQQVAMTLGLPAASLQKVGVKGLPQEYVLPLQLKGPVEDPKFDWAAATKRLGALSSLQLARLGQHWHAGGGTPSLVDKIPGGRALIHRVEEATTSFLDQVDSAIQKELQQVPQPQRPFPWE